MMAGLTYPDRKALPQMQDINDAIAALTTDAHFLVRPSEATELQVLARYDDESGLCALTRLSVMYRDDAERHDCTIVWHTDVDGEQAQCTLLSSGGNVLSTFRAHGN